VRFLGRREGHILSVLDGLWVTQMGLDRRILESSAESVGDGTVFAYLHRYILFVPVPSTYVYLLQVRLSLQCKGYTYNSSPRPTTPLLPLSTALHPKPPSKQVPTLQYSCLTRQNWHPYTSSFSTPQTSPLYTLSTIAPPLCRAKSHLPLQCANGILPAKRRASGGD
jgi:hypothetical protein